MTSNAQNPREGNRREVAEGFRFRPPCDFRNDITRLEPSNLYPNRSRSLSPPSKFYVDLFTFLILVVLPLVAVFCRGRPKDFPFILGPRIHPLSSRHSSEWLFGAIFNAGIFYLFSVVFL